MLAAAIHKGVAQVVRFMDMLIFHIFTELFLQDYQCMCQNSVLPLQGLPEHVPGS
jgi:hypothetical protein